MSDLDRFELFIAVAQLGSLTQAAKSVRLSKASLSKQIKKLEAELRINLFLRSGQRLHLTEQGKLLLQQCLRLQKELEDTRAICRGFHEKPKGTLSIVALDFFAREIIYPRLKAFRQEYPDIDVFMDASERIPRFEQEKVDIAVGFSLAVPNPSEVIQRRLATTRHVMCASAGYFEKHPKPEKLADLYQHAYIGHSAREEVCSDHLKDGFEIRLKPTLVLNNVAGMIECAKNGLGIVQLPFYLVEKHLRSGELVEVLSAYQARDAGVYYFYPRFRHMQPKLRCFIDFFLKDYSRDFL